MTPQEQFITERRYLKSVTPATVTWYEQAFRRFEGALEPRGGNRAYWNFKRAGIIGRIHQLSLASL